MIRFPRLAIALPLIALAGCVAPKPKVVAPAPPPPVVAPPAPVLSDDWRDWPLSPGGWTYAAGTARFGVAGGAASLTLRCDAPAGVVVLTRAAPPATAARAIQLTTSEGVRALAAVARPDGVAASLTVRDAWLDRLAFSRGRIVVAVSGLPRLVVPVWAEIGRVVEDCRG